MDRSRFTDPNDPEGAPRRLTRRRALRLGAGASGAVLLGLAGCTASDEELLGGDGDSGGTDDSGEAEASGNGDGRLLFLSTQLAPVEEAEAMRGSILAGFERDVEFVGEDAGPFADRVMADAEAGDGEISLLGGLHGDFSAFVERDMLEDLSDLAEELADRGLNQDFLDLAGFGGDGIHYIPWMQATYIMVARREALDYLPDGADPEALTYEQWTQWGARIREETGAERLGLPAADDGLIHRFFQGFAYPSFTGALNTRFRSSEAVEMWEWMRGAWEYTNPQAVTYGFLQEPLRSGEVWVGWDHVARLIEAMRADPDEFVALPTPRGPKGLGHMPVVAGLAIPKNARDKEGAKELIEYLTRPETSATTLREVGFYPPTNELDLPDDLDPGIAAQAEAVAQQGAHSEAILSLLPVGLGEQNGAYNDVFRSTFERIALDDEDISEVLDDNGARLQEILDDADAACWQPDPESDGPCQVG